jgi:hypothetical protein
MQTTPETPIRNKRPQRIFAGVLLIVLGAAILLQQWFDIANLVVLLLGLGMLTWGSITHKSGWIIPGGVLTGIGMGILVMESPWQFQAVNQSAIFLLCFAFGWFLIGILTSLFARSQWWAFIPGGIMAFIGIIILVKNGMAPWLDINLVYAVILITIGLVLLLFRGRPHHNG